MSATIGKRIIRLSEVGSTNTYLKDNSELLKEHGLVVIAEMQTSGRGRAGRKFVSLPQKNVTFSVVMHPGLALGEVQVFALLAGIVVARVLEKYINGVRLKWPNDVLVNGKKICGILLETITIPQQNFPVLILGIGLNTKGFLKDYPQELQKIVTTLEAEIYQNSNVINGTEDQPALENETIFQLLLSELECYFAEFSNNTTANREVGYLINARSALLNEWLKRSQAKGRKVRSLNNIEEQTKGSGTVGTIVGLTKEGYLQIRTETGEIMTHVSGDILEIREEE
jgi:BirA family biotin operon repressor/biotin-[acetyl-CoA-carboxylase] ligase